MNRKRITKSALLLLIGVGAAAGATFPARQTSAQDCSAYEVDDYTEHRCVGEEYARQVWIYYLPSECGGTQYSYGPWYNTHQPCNY
jgi:hypothetical protein